MTREAPLENRTALCLASQLPPRGHPLGATRRELPGHGAARLCPDFAPGIYEIASSARPHPCVALPRGQPFESNFYQLPVVIRSVKPVDDGTLMDADVCDKVDCSGTVFLYQGLRLVSVPSTEEGNPYFVGEKAELLGISASTFGARLISRRRVKRKLARKC